jgi:N6-adenosine-specific RNA methylase IME4
MGASSKPCLDRCQTPAGRVTPRQAEVSVFRWISEPVTTKRERNLVEGLNRGHSRKPEEAYALCERWLPCAHRRLELFSRTDRPGWKSWGDEAGKFNVTREAAMDP